MFKSFEQIRDELFADITKNTGWTDGTSGALAYTLANVIARALRVVWFMLEQILKLFFVSTSKGSFLERRCNERGVFRKQGTKSKGTVNLTRSTAAPVGSSITQGTVLSTMDQKIEFTVDSTVTLPAGWTSIPVPVTCNIPGTAGNLAAGVQLRIVSAQVVGVQNIAVAASGLTGGTDTESDEQLRDRYLYTIRNPLNGGTPSDYVVWATSIPGVLSAIPLPLARGNGTVDVVISDGGIPSDELVQKVSSYVRTKCPIGADARVIKPTATVVNVTGAVTADQGYTNAVLAPLVKQAVVNYLAKVPIGGTVRLTDIILAARSVKGVLDFSMTAPTTNVQLVATGIATPGTLNIT
ncbi:baseplate J/gp47 family protein [Paenibacillus elgii]